MERCKWWCRIKCIHVFKNSLVQKYVADLYVKESSPKISCQGKRCALDVQCFCCVYLGLKFRPRSQFFVKEQCIIPTCLLSRSFNFNRSFHQPSLYRLNYLISAFEKFVSIHYSRPLKHIAGVYIAHAGNCGYV